MGNSHRKARFCKNCEYCQCDLPPWPTTELTPRERLCDFAAANGHLQCLVHFREQLNCTWDENVFAYANKGDHIDCMIYAYRNDCPGKEKYYSKISNVLLAENWGIVIKHIQNQIIIRRYLRLWRNKFLARFYTPGEKGYHTIIKRLKCI